MRGTRDGIGTLATVGGRPELAWGIVLAVLPAATVFDLRSRRVPAAAPGASLSCPCMPLYSHDREEGSAGAGR
jgi:hypothetical protein